jgi:hypothetical protein
LHWTKCRGPFPENIKNQVSAKKEEVESALKDVGPVSKGKRKRAKSCISNCMEKVLFQVIRDEISFFENKKKQEKKSKKVSDIFSGLIT